VETDRFAKLKEILLQAADLSEAERRAFLDEACKDDPDLRKEVESILAHENDATGIMQTGGVVPPASIDSHPEALGPYKILEPIGEGGMGIVYLAEQTEPVRRRVALKVIKLGMDTKQVVARFEAERQALAMMDHPNIAKVLDAGATPDGRPYFVMEHVHGIPITDYCDRHELKMPERLELFTQICEAVQHAHQKGVIHRDLKPSNVLVEVVGDHPVPKVIDFGVAKATAHRLTERTVYTEQGQLIGTPEYMSPEQAEMTRLNVDTRTDIYSLGVLLYELLVGALPLEPETLRRASYAEIQRILREVDPPRPSTRLSSLGAATDTVAKRRRTDRSSLLGQLRGDLDWITMKALEKDRTRRYASASELAADVRRFLNDEPILARPPSPAYRMRKYVKRHRVGVGFAATIGLAVAIGFILLTVQNAKIAAARDEAELVTATLEEMLASVDPTKSGRDVTVKEMLDETAKTLGERFQKQPLVEARLRSTVGRTYYELGEYGSAAEHLERAVGIRRETLGEEDLGTLATMDDLARAYMKHGRAAEGELIAREALEIDRRVFGEEHQQTLRAMHTLGLSYAWQDRQEGVDQAGSRGSRAPKTAALYRECLEISRRVLGEEHPQTLEVMLNLGNVCRRLGRYDEAITLLRESSEACRRALGDEHPQTLRSLVMLAATYKKQGHLEEAQALFRETLESRRRVLGEQHHETSETMYFLANTYMDLGRYVEAERVLREGLQFQRRDLGEEHPRTLECMHRLGYMLWEQGRLEEAEAILREALEIRRRVLGEEHPGTLNSMNSLALVYMRQGRYEQAEPLLRETLETMRRVNGNDHLETNLAMGNLAFTCGELGKDSEAEALWHEMLEITRRTLGEEHPETLGSVFQLAFLFLRQGRYDEAEAVNRRALENCRRARGEDNTLTDDFRFNLACSLAMQGRREEAASLLRETLDNGYEARGDWYWKPDFTYLRGDPELEVMVEELKPRNEDAEPATVE
jgi:serine/threonine protein kinase/tetratricopeptide (TPR) repeat protein